MSGYPPQGDFRPRNVITFPSVPSAVITVPAVAADITFPNVVIASLPSGITIARAELILVISRLLDTSGAENQIDVASKTLRIKVSTGAWGTDDIVALTFQQNSLECGASSYGAGAVIFGATDISSVVTGNATFNLMCDETNGGDAPTVTGASLELQDVTALIKVEFD